MYIIFRYVYFSAVLLVSPVCLFSDLFTLGSKNNSFTTKIRQRSFQETYTDLRM